MGLDHKDTHCVTPGDPGASAGSLVGRVRVQKVLGLLPTHLWVKSGPGIGAGPLTAKPMLQSGDRAQESRDSVRLLVGVVASS